MRIKTGYTFDDLLLVPKFSDIESRADVDLSVDLGKGVKLWVPIVSANMKHVTESKMIQALAGRWGGLPILHRFFPSIQDTAKEFRDSLLSTSLQSANRYPAIGASVGVQESDKELAAALVEAGCKILCIDIAHGDSKRCYQMTEYLAKTYPHILLIAGNVATGSAAYRLAQHGADVVKVGIGPGSLCSTRIETGNGVPQMTALEDCYLESLARPGGRKFKIIADGGISKAGDIVKALCFSDAVMIGNLLAGTDEAPGMFVGTSEGTFKQYEGSSTHKNKHVEGVKALVRAVGSLEGVMTSLLEGIRSGCSYQGADNLSRLRVDPQFVSISYAGSKESYPHSVTMLKA